LLNPIRELTQLKSWVLGFISQLESTHKIQVIYRVKWLKKEMEKESNYKKVKWDSMWQGIGMGEGDVIGCWLFCAQIS